MNIVIQKGDLTQITCDAIVNPANSYGFMGGGVAGAIKRVGGTQIEKEAISKAPIPVGSAIHTDSGSLPCKYVIHAPTMRQPAMRINVENVKAATQAAFKLGIKLGLRTIAIPGMGTGVGGVPVDDAAKLIVNISKKFIEEFDKIFLIDRNEEMIEAFRKYL
ncbi:MAG: macro domain-containing protein [Thermoplasmatales archaeon]|jgi:O-acetyl-ADP-ribose deacetylase (regulator of RNase III)|nr:MAG: macro domain-containing protein [Thermoplasmatales archaeon]